jgi:hypothetical protein
MTTMTLWNTRGAFARLCLTFLLFAPSLSCECESEFFVDPPGGTIGSSLAGILIISPGSGYVIGDPVSFGSPLLGTAGAGAEAHVLDVDAAGAVMDIEITNRGEGYLVPPPASAVSEAGKGCVLQTDIRVVEICRDNELEKNLNGIMRLTVGELFGTTELEFLISGVCFSVLGSDECFLAVNGTHAFGDAVEFEVTIFTTTLNEFIDDETHVFRANDEGMILAHKVDLDGDGDYEFSEGEITFYTALGGAVDLPGATVDLEVIEGLEGEEPILNYSFGSYIYGTFDKALDFSGSFSFTDCD